jgi:SAM-dependent methyltransferase
MSDATTNGRQASPTLPVHEPDPAGAGGRTTFSPAMEAAASYNGWIVDRFRQYLGRAVLEVGFGHGGFRALLPQDVAYAGLDIDDGIVERARRLDPRGLYFRGDICDDRLATQLGSYRPDSVLCVNVLEHVRDDLTALRGLLSILPEHGRLLLLVPACPRLYNRLDRLAGHFRRYDRTALSTLINAAGGRAQMLDYFNPLGALTWRLAGLWRRESMADPGIASQVRLFVRFVLPLSRALDPWCRRVVGQSLVAVIRPEPERLALPRGTG